MSLIKKFILGAAFIVCPFFQSAVMAEEKKFNIHYNLLDKDNDIKDIVENTLHHIIKKDGKDIPFLDLSINIGQQYKTASYTDAKNNYCKIDISYHNQIPLLLDNFQDDLQFILAHEIGHCILGKEIFYKQKFNWVIQLDDIEKINTYLENQTNLSINSLECKTCPFRVAPPIAVYHEIYADIYALNWLSANEKNLYKILALSKKRINEFNQNPLISFYGSGFSIPILLEYMGEKNQLPTAQRVEEVSQKGFINYLKFMSENYFTNRNKIHE
jgi:hypothetical protein